MLPPQTTPTALLVIDLQLGLTHPTAHGPTRSTPNLEFNLTKLLSSVRAYNASRATSAHGVHIIHVHHNSVSPESLLHPTHIISWSEEAGVNGRRGIEAMPCAAPLPGERVFTKIVNSAFIGTDLEAVLRGAGIKQVIIVGMTTEHCVSTTVRMAANLDVCGYGLGHAEGIVLVEDGCACFGKERGQQIWDAETVHLVEIECLRGEFAEVVGTEEVVRMFGSGVA